MENILIGLLRRWRLLAGLDDGNKTHDSAHNPAWLEAVRRGDFTAVPRALDWEGAAPLIYLIDGYKASEQWGLGDLMQAAGRLRSLDSNGEWLGSALELWCFLFYEHRRFRHGGWPPEGDDLTRLNRLSGLLRDVVLEASPPEREKLLSIMK